MFIVNILLVVALAKMTGSTIKFYTAAALYAVVFTIFAFLLSTNAEPSSILAAGAIRFAIGLPYFYLLDRFEDTIFTWLIILVLGGGLLGFF